MKHLFLPLLLTSAFAHAIEFRAHTGEVIYQKKGESEIRVVRPIGRETTDDLLTRLRNSNKFNFVDFNTIEKLDPQADVGLNNQWHHGRLHTQEAWNQPTPQESVLVAVCDSGVQADHEDLRGQVLPGWNLIDNVQDNSTTSAHGTFVGGLIAAQVNSFGVAGISPHAKILPLRISDANGSSNMKLITDCIRMAADRGAHVVNVSFTGVDHPAVEAAGAYARSKGTLLVYAAGNHGLLRSKQSYPDYPNVLAVGGTNRSDKRWTYRKNIFLVGGSNYGEFIDLMAPGHELTSTAKYNPAFPEQAKYRTGSGTSYAAPVVTAVAALVYAVNPNFTPAQVEKILKDSADAMGNPQHYDAGRVNAVKAVKLAMKRR